MRKLILPALCCVVSLCATAQKKSETYKFEKISPEMLSRKVYDVDSNAHAVILADVGTTEIEGNAKGWFSFVFRRHKRVHILHKNGYDEATFQIPLYHNGRDNEERLESIKAVAYNLENGQVVETKLAKENIFTEEESKNRSIKKFTLPSVKEGTIIDVEYRVLSDYLTFLEPWTFQGMTPSLWSDYTVSIPQFLDYNFIYKGFTQFHINERKERQGYFSVIIPGGLQSNERFNFNSIITDYRWVTRNVKGFKLEPFLTTPANYLSHMEFQLSALKDPLRYTNLVPSWQEKTKELLESESFGQKLDANNGWLREVMEPLMKGTEEQQARNIYNYVRDHISCNGSQGVSLSQPVKNVFKTSMGTVADVNLLLVTMLRYANLKADPVMLSTREHGTVFTMYPMLTRFNYVIASCKAGDKTFYLDASKARLGFGRLPYNCYNGMARTINADADPVIFSSDSLQEKKITSVFLTINDKKGWSGTVQQVPGYYESSDIRGKLKEKGREAVTTEFKKGIGSQITVTNLSFDSIDRYEHPLGVRAELQMDLNGEDLLYINPMFGQGQKENPFKSAERAFPVEMPYTINEQYNLTFYVPDGYEVDELPKSIRVKYNEENEGMFEYLISQSEGIVSMRTSIRLDRSVFIPEEYELLREFFNMIVAKHKEQIVLKKKK